MKTLCLDVSTSVVGWSLTDAVPDGMVLCDFGAIDIRTSKSLETLFQKFDKVNLFLKTLNGIDRVVIEQANVSFRQGGSSAQVLAILQTFNGMISVAAYQLFGKEPDYIMASMARKNAGITLVKGGDNKEQVFEWLYSNCFDFRTRVEAAGRTPKGNPKPVFYDMCDAIVLALGTKNGQKATKKKKSKRPRKNKEISQENPATPSVDL